MGCDPSKCENLISEYHIPDAEPSQKDIQSLRTIRITIPTLRSGFNLGDVDTPSKPNIDSALMGDRQEFNESPSLNHSEYKALQTFEDHLIKLPNQIVCGQVFLDFMAIRDQTDDTLEYNFYLLGGEQYFIGDLNQRIGIFLTQELVYEGAQNPEQQFHGSGLMVTHQFSYRGQFESGKYHGNGTLITRSGGKYIGQWKQNQKDGHGEEWTPEGVHYKGPYVNGAQEGNDATLELRDGSSYEGSVHNGLQHGAGTMKWPNGRTQKGSWKDGMMHGKGELTLPDGRRYVGDFEAGVKEGFGEFTWPDGTRYIGEFQEGRQGGMGTLIDKRGLRQVYWWENGKRIQKCDQDTGILLSGENASQIL